MKAEEKMDCQRADELLVDFLYGELTPVLHAAFEEHLEGCPTHAEEIGKLRAVLDIVRGEKVEEVPEQVSRRIVRLARAVDEQNSQPGSLWRRLVLSPVAAAAVLVGLIVVVGISVQFSRNESAEIGPEAVSVLPAPAPGEKNTVTRNTQRLETTTSEELAREQKAPALSGPATGRLGDRDGERPGRDKPMQVFKQARPRPAAAGRKYKKSAKRKPATKSANKIGTLSKGVANYYPAEEGKQEMSGEEDLQVKLAKKKEWQGDWSKTGASGAPAAVGGVVSAKDDRANKPIRDFAKPPPGMSEPKKHSRGMQAKDEKAPRPERKLAEAPTPVDGVSADLAEQESAASESVESTSSRRSAVKASVAKKARQKDLYAMAEEDLAAKRYRQALSNFRAFIQRFPEDSRLPTCRYRLAKTLFLMGNCAQAITAVEQATSSSAHHAMAAPALLDKASCQVRLGRFDQARATYNRIITDYPTYATDARRGLERIER
jgi:TolA-binding protein